VGSSERHYGWGEQNISLILKVPRHCPFVLLVSVNFFNRYYLFFLRWGGGVNGLRKTKILKLPLGGLYVKHTEQRGISVPTQHLLWDQGKPRKTLIELGLQG
jgi:hypothetical protein